VNAALRLGDRWGLAEASDRRFRRLCGVVLPLLFAAVLLLPQGPWTPALPEPRPEPLRVQILPPPLPPAPPVKPVEPPPAKTVVAQKPVVPAAPAVRPQPQTARAVAERAGMADIRRQLAALQSGDAPSATRQQPLLQEVALSQRSGSHAAEAWSAEAVRGSGGIGQGERGVSAVQPTGSLGARRTGVVRSTLATGESGGAGTASAPAAGRSLQDIQLAFDRSKSSFFAIFNRAARERAGMGAGQIVVSLTIAPDGSVTRCDLVASSFSDAELEQKILQRVKLLNFGAKNVPAYTYPNYPIHFLPS